MKRVVLAVIVALVFAFAAPAVGHAENLSGCVDVNKASAREIATLKWFGPKLSKAVVNVRATKRRKQKGWGYPNWATLMRLVKGVGKRHCTANVGKVCFSGKRQKTCPR